MQSHDMSQSVLEAVFDLFLLYVPIFLLFGFLCFLPFSLVSRHPIYVISDCSCLMWVPGTFWFPMSEYNI